MRMTINTLMNTMNYTEMIEVAISGKGNLLFPQDFKVRVKESIPSEFTLEWDGITPFY